MLTFQRIKSRYISYPTALAVFEEELYWANQVDYDDDSSLNKILTANKFLANNSLPTEVVSKLHDTVSELHIFHAAVQMEGKSLLCFGGLNSTEIPRVGPGQSHPYPVTFSLPHLLYPLVSFSFFPFLFMHPSSCFSSLPILPE